eukprot:CAMPEP_0180692142 /NCGR_PEP_ID=MMETSP1038_2-20121128/658_1 /TAXON_ID=632150 /ORGANISM="Azadinium spinosum, Strain 3D9" /LENGTH=50 /DNA_ID=CAMNT_0022723275 /DNA_START=152 /DNA_END=301 /DNA_ORIENTATION=-
MSSSDIIMMYFFMTSLPWLASAATPVPPFAGTSGFTLGSISFRSAGSKLY